MPPKPRNRDRLSVYLLSIGLFIGVAALALLVTRGYAIDLDSLSVQKRGVIVLRSEPDSAVITLDGKELDQRTDARLSLAPDTYDLTVRAPDRIPWEREVRLEPGEAAIQEIILFPESPERTEVTERPVARSAVSPEGRRIAAVVRSGGTASLRLLDASGERRYAVGLDAVPRRVAVDDEGFVLTESSGRIAVYAPEGKRVAAISGSRGRFVGNRVVFQQERRVVETDRTGQDRRTIATAPSAWTATDRRTYVLDRTGTVSGTLPGRSAERIEGTGTVAGISGIGGDAVQVAGRDGSFGVIRDGSFKAIGTGEARATLSSDEAFVAYRTNREIRLFEWETGRNRLVTSLTEPPARVTAFPGGSYVLYRRGGTLHAISRDGSNDRVVAGDIGGEPVFLGPERIFVKDGRTGRLVRIDLERPE